MKLFSKLGIRGKILISVIVVLVMFFIVEALLLDNIFLSGFKSVEEQDMVSDIQRVEGLISDQINNYSIKLIDWANWDDAYNFVVKPNDAFIESNLGDVSLTNLKLNFMVFIASSGAIVKEKGVSLDTGKDMPIPQDLHNLLSKPNIVTTHTALDSKSQGIVRLSEGFMLFASRPILTSNATGPIRGTIIFARYIDKPFLTKIADLERSKITIWNYNSNQLPQDVADAKNLMPTQGVKYKESDGDIDLYFVNQKSASAIFGYTTVFDIYDKQAFIVRNELPRPFFALGNRLVIVALLLFAIVSSFSLVIAFLMLNSLVIAKITKLNKDVRLVSDPNNPKNKLDIKGNDEFATLASNINKMLDEITKSEGTLKQNDQILTQEKLLLGQKVAELNNSQKAMLNVLEDQKKIQDQLKLSSQDLEKFKLAIENTSDHIIMTNPDGKIIYANHAAEILTGFSREEMYGKTPALWGKQMPQEFYVKMWDTIKNKKQPFGGEITNKKKTGELYTVDARITPILGENKELLFFIGVERDLSAEKKLADQLLKQNQEIEKQVKEQTKEISQESERLFKFLNTMPEGVFVLDAKGKPFYANSESKRLLGKGIMDKNPSEFSEVYHAYIRGTNKLYPWDQNPVVQALSGKITTVKDCEVQNGDKRTPLEITGAPIMDDDGNIIYAIAVFRDITQELMQERSKDEFFSIASHELRTPLTAIRGNTALIQEYYKDKLQDKDLSEMIDDIHSSSIRLIQIVNDFLSLSRLEQGKMEFKLANFDIKELIAKQIVEIEQMVKEKNLAISFDSSVTIPLVYADKDRLSEVILNLLGNAIKYSEKGEIKVKVGLENDFVKVLISDTGRGIPVSQQNLLFRKFQQAGESILTRDTTKGTGLGLYISKLIIDNMGGKIQLESSTENQGSVFSFIVPVAK